MFAPFAPARIPNWRPVELTIDQYPTPVQKLHLSRGVPQDSMLPDRRRSRHTKRPISVGGTQMSPSTFSATWHNPWQPILLTLITVGVGGSPVRADVITDWDAKISSVASPAALGEREATIVDLAMFDAVNSVLRQYPGHVTREDGFEHASTEAAAASAAATVLAKLHPEKAADFTAAHGEYLKGLAAEPAAVALG